MPGIVSHVVLSSGLGLSEQGIMVGIQVNTWLCCTCIMFVGVVAAGAWGRLLLGQPRY